MSKEKLKKITTKFQNQKANHGITLIALIITIVVMLILVAVILAIALGENGVINTTKESKEKTNIEIEREKLLDAVMGAYNVETGEVDFEKIDNNLPEGFTGSNGTYTSESGNKFTVDKDGNVTYIGKEDGTTEENEKDLDLLSDYFLGKIDEITGERTGRNIVDLLVSIEVEDVVDWQFKEIDGIEIDEENIKAIGFDDSADGKYDVSIVIKYNGELYTLIVGAESMNCKSLEEKTIKVGDYVEYDGIEWKILYADDTHGIQMVSVENLEYNGDEFILGKDDSLISNWNLLISEADINKDLELNEAEKRAYSYNHAIETLNKACENIVTKNENIIDVRCLGSDPIDKNKEGGVYSSEKLAIWPIDNEVFAPGMFNGKMKNRDTNYELDYNKLVELNLIDVKDDNYWLASRELEIFESGAVNFCVRMMRWNSNSPKYGAVIGVTDRDAHDCGASGVQDTEAYLRPVVKLKPDIKFNEGCGSSDYPYILK